MKILIIEDESLAAEKLQLLVKQYDPSIEIMACLESVEETVEWLNKNRIPTCC
jgi:DNA-binding NarL/FixJ family response regulator